MPKALHKPTTTSARYCTVLTIFFPRDWTYEMAAPWITRHDLWDALNELKCRPDDKGWKYVTGWLR